MKYVEGFVENIIFRNEDNGYTVFNIVYDEEEITCVGVLSYINTGEFITAQGEFVKHAVYYMQFKIISYEFKAPEDAASVKRYLSSGAIKGIGEKMAERIVNEFGDDTFRIIHHVKMTMAVYHLIPAIVLAVRFPFLDTHDMTCSYECITSLT